MWSPAIQLALNSPLPRYGYKMQLTNVERVADDHLARLVPALTSHLGARTVGSADRVANVAGAALHGASTRTQTIACQYHGIIYVLVVCPWVWVSLPLVRHQLSIHVDETVIEVELGVGQLGASVVGSALVGGAVCIKGRHRRAVLVDVHRVRAVVGELAIVDHLTGNGCGASGKGKEGKDEQLDDRSHVGDE